MRYPGGITTRSVLSLRPIERFLEELEIARLAEWKSNSR